MYIYFILVKRLLGEEGGNASSIPIDKKISNFVNLNSQVKKQSVMAITSIP